MIYIQISPSAKLSELRRLIKQTAHEAEVEYSQIFGDVTKTVAEAGLVNGTVLQFQNGMDD
jgi:hypothetical protein